jgi:hypothetical protein
MRDVVTTKLSSGPGTAQSALTWGASIGWQANVAPAGDNSATQAPPRKAVAQALPLASAHISVKLTASPKLSQVAKWLAHATRSHAFAIYTENLFDILFA